MIGGPVRRATADEPITMRDPSGQRDAERSPVGPWRRRLHEIIFEAETPAGRGFDVALLVAIVLSVLAVVLESVRAIREAYGSWLLAVEWSLTVLFTIEYALRLASVERPLRYARSFFGIVDLLAVLPTYLSLLLPGAQALLVVRALRLLRVFRILKLAHFLGEAQVLRSALRASLRKISVFLFTVLVMVLIVGSLMYLIEGEKSGFSSIPLSIYWAIVTLTTVGYGDIAPQTVLGQILASVVMIVGYGIIAVPTGIVTVELSRAWPPKVSTQSCPRCSAEGHDPDASYCKFCGSAL
jgi:voltage-gated potassium channel